MKLFTLGVALALVIAVAIMALANIELVIEDSGAISLENGLSTYKEKSCADNPDDVTCTETIYIECNGEKYDVPVMTGYTVHDKVYITEYVEKEKVIIEEKKARGEEKPNPADRNYDEDISVFSDSVRIYIKNAEWRKYIDSNSMDPLIDEGSITIEVKPKKNDIQVGDIISYNLDNFEYTLVHRVVRTGEDENGTYYITQGDNYWQEDPYKVRFESTYGVVVGILY